VRKRLEERWVRILLFPRWQKEVFLHGRMTTVKERDKSHTALRQKKVEFRQKCGACARDLKNTPVKDQNPKRSTRGTQRI